MRSRTRPPAPWFLLFAAFLRCPEPAREAPAARADIVVAQDTSGTYHAINDALRAARPGQTILVMPGVYHEQVRFEGTGRLTLMGHSPASTVIDGTDRYAAVEFRSDSNRVSGFTLRGADSHGAWIRDGHQTIDHCLVVGNGERGIYASALAGNASVQVDHCTVVDNGETGIYAARDSAGTAVTNCIIARNRRGIVAEEHAGLVGVGYNCVHNRLADFENVVPGPGNITLDPMFRLPDSGDYTIDRRSPCRRAGSDGSDLGCFPYR